MGKKYKISIKMEDIKKIFSIKEQKNYVITKKILGITLKYTRGKTYNELCKILTYLNNETKFHISESLINDFQKKIPLKHISSEIFEKDYQNFKDLLNEIDARELPPSTGEIRELQLNTLKLAKEITKDIENNTDIKLWLDGGALLGAVRHKGFIPWDDDIDIATNRSDYTKLQAYLSEKYQFINTDDWRYCDYSTKINEILKIYPDQIFCFKYGDSFKCVKGIADLFYIVDFFAWDYINTCHNIFTFKEYMTNINIQLNSYEKFKDIFEFYKNELKKTSDIVEESDILAPGIDNAGFHNNIIKEFVRKSDIYPLKKIMFEDWEFYAPNNTHAYLKSLYNFYMKLPVKNFKIFAHVNTKIMQW